MDPQAAALIAAMSQQPAQAVPQNTGQAPPASQPAQAAPTQPAEPEYARTTTDAEIYRSLLERYSGATTGDDTLDVSEVATNHAPPSPSVLKLDKWSLRRGQEIADALYAKAEDDAHDIGRSVGFETGRFREAMPAGDDPMYDQYVQADIHAACFEPEPKFADNPTDTQRSEWMKRLMETPDFQTMHNQCMLDDTLSSIATEAISTQYATYVKQEVVQQQQSPAGNQASNASGVGGGNGKYIRQAISASQAVRHAKKEVAEAVDAMSALGNDMLKDDVQAIFKAIRKNPQLKKIVELAGRYRRLAQTKQRQKSIHGMDDIAGVTIGGDIKRLIPSELAMLGDEELELEECRKIAESQAMQFQFCGFQTKDKGPIIVTVDESGSMGGDRIANAKALAMAMAWVAKNQKRWCALVAFSGHSVGRWVALPPDKWNAEALLEWIAAFDGGGTVPDVPLVTVPFQYFEEMGAPKGKTDLITITDGGMYVDPQMITDFNEWKEREHAKHYFICIDDEPADFAKTADKTWKIKALNIEESCVSELVSI